MLSSNLVLGRDLGYLELKTYEILNNQVTEVKRMLTGLIQKLNAECLAMISFLAGTWATWN